MTQEAREKRNEYYRKYRETHKEQMKATYERYWAKKARVEANNQNEIAKDRG